MEKIKFPKNKRKIEVVDIGMKDYPGVFMYVWDDPSREVVFTLIRSVLAENPTEESVNAYFDAACRYIIESNVDGLNFDTVEDTIDSFRHPDLPWGFMYEFIALAVAELMEESNKLKKVLRGRSKTRSTRDENESEVEKSKND